MTRCGSRRTGSPTTSTSGTSSGTRARIRSTRARSRTASSAASARTARSEAAAATIAGMFSKPADAPRLPLVGGPLGGEPDALAHGEQPDPRRAAPLVRARRQQRPAPGHRPPAERLRRVHQQRHPGRPRRPRRPRPPAAPCPPRGWPTGDRPARCPSRSASRVRRRRTPRPSGPPAPRSPSPPSPPRAPPPRAAPRSARPRRRPGGARHADAPRARRRSRVHRARPRRGEDQLVRAAADGLRRGLPRRVQQQPGPPPLAVEPGGIGPALVQGGQQRLPGDGVQGSGGGGVEVGHAATLTRRCRTAGPGPSDAPRTAQPGRQMPIAGRRRIPPLRGVGRRVGHPPRATPNSVQ